jgi:hypothetical protein
MTIIRSARQKAALVALLAALSLGGLVLPATTTTRADPGPSGTLCGSTDLLTAWYAYQYSDMSTGVHYHGWDPIPARNDGDWFDWGPC